MTNSQCTCIYQNGQYVISKSARNQQSFTVCVDCSYCAALLHWVVTSCVHAAAAAAAAAVIASRLQFGREPVPVFEPDVPSGFAHFTIEMHTGDLSLYLCERS
jgi:hypothetical protein